MSEFVDECRREWKRLRVPDPVANEMAADLAADLEEAEAEGASAEEVLGSGAFDPRSFAASWAAERGVVPPPPGQGASPSPRRSRMPVAIAIAVFVATIVVGLVMLTSRPGVSVQRSALALPFGPVPRAEVAPTFGPRGRLVPPVHDFAVLNGPVAAVHTVGLVLLLIGIVGLILTLLYWSPWAGERSLSRRRA